MTSSGVSYRLRFRTVEYIATVLQVIITVIAIGGTLALAAAALLKSN